MSSAIAQKGEINSQMTKLYLITGFLGAGKTTFLKKLVPHFKDKKIALVINEFGANSVDGKLLADLDASIAEIDNGSIFCSCRVEQFENAVMDIIETRSPDFIFVEASGLADPTSVGSIFSQPIYKDMEYAGAICIVDAARFHKVYRSTTVSRMQLAVSDLVLINKTDIAPRELIDDVVTIAKAQKPNRPVFETSFGEFRREWLEALDFGKADSREEKPRVHTKDITLSRATVAVSGFTPDRLRAFLKMFAEETYRIKGFVNMGGQNYLVDCVGPVVDVRIHEGEVDEPGRLAVLYGKGLHAKRAITEAAGWFEDCGVEILGKQGK